MMMHHDFLCFARLALVPDDPIETFLPLVAAVCLVATTGFLGRNSVAPKNVLYLDFISHLSLLEEDFFGQVLELAVAAHA